MVRGEPSAIYVFFYGRIYRWWSELIHRHGYHHLKTKYPADENGVHPRLYCDWCGASSSVPRTTEQLLKAMAVATLDRLR